MVEFALVVTFIFVLFLGILQMILLMYAYNTLALSQQRGDSNTIAIDCSLTPGSRCEGERCSRWICLTICRTITACHNLFTESGHELTRLFAIYKAYIDKAQLLLLLDKRRERICLFSCLSKEQIAASTVVQISI